MKILLVNPEIPDTFWSFRYALKFIRKASSEPPLGLLTVAALLPAEWQKRLVDMNVEPLKDKQICLGGLRIPHRYAYPEKIIR